MNTIAWILIFLGVLLLRGVSKGRGLTDLPKDIGDIFTGVMANDTKAVKEVLGRTGAPEGALAGATLGTVTGASSGGSSDGKYTTSAPNYAPGTKDNFPGTIVDLARYLQSKYGVRIGELEPFDTVERVHAPNSDHYRGLAMDIGMAGQTKEKLDMVAADARGKGFWVLWQTAGHYDHVHISDRRNR